MSDVAINIDARELTAYLPHRYPFLLVDKVIELDAAGRIKAIKNVTINEPFFRGHFESYPVMPGVLVIEALAQAAGILSIHCQAPRPENEMYFLVGIDKARFKRQIVPGDQLVLDVAEIGNKRGIARFMARALVEDQLACQAEIVCARREV